MAEIAVLSFGDDQQVVSLFERSTSAEGSYGWFQCLAESTLAMGEEAILAVAFDNGTAKAALPLVRRGRAIRSLTAPYTTIYAPALPDPQWAYFLGRRAAAYVKGSLQLDAVDAVDPGLLAYLQGVRSSGLIAARYRHFDNYFERIDDFEKYWSSRPTRLRMTVRRKMNQLPESAEFHCYRDDLAAAVAVYEDIYRSSWKGPEPHPSFIAKMVDILGRDRFVRLGVMTVAGEPIAAQIWLVCERKATIFKLAHRRDAAAYSPGTLLTHWLVSTLIREEGLEEIDFGRGEDTYKRDWLAQRRPRSGLVAGNWTSLAGLAAIGKAVIPTRLSQGLLGRTHVGADGILAQNDPTDGHQ